MALLGIYRFIEEVTFDIYTDDIYTFIWLYQLDYQYFESFDF